MPPGLAIGIMQGRLTPPVRGIQAFPRESWRDEFPAAKAARLDFIEWIFDQFGADVNPIMTADGLKEMRSLADGNGVGLHSVCADYFMDCPLLKCSPPEQLDRLTMLNSLLSRCASLKIHHVVLPFVDASRMDSEQEQDAFVKMTRGKILPEAEKHKIEIHLETSLPPNGVAALLERIPHELFWINYDSGNSSSLGYKPVEEFAAYGKRIGSFHIKDRVLGGTTVPLGAGNADFPALAGCLREAKYSRPFVLQVARGEVGHEVEWAKRNRASAEALLKLKE